MLQVIATPQFEKDIRKVPEQLDPRIEQTIARLKRNPLDESLRVKKLRQFKRSVWRVRIGSYRLIYYFDKTSLTLLHIRHRKDVYRNL
jgi:mRNA-degrading endonuclease RelE of RelBE toxin-antitoxin system